MTYYIYTNYCPFLDWLQDEIEWKWKLKWSSNERPLNPKRILPPWSHVKSALFRVLRIPCWSARRWKSRT